MKAHNQTVTVFNHLWVPEKHKGVTIEDVRFDVEELEVVGKWGEVPVYRDQDDDGNDVWFEML